LTTLPPAYREKLQYLDQTAALLQKQLAAVSAEAKVDGLEPVARTCERKAGAVRHLREDLQGLPARFDPPPPTDPGKGY
jgi:hypothetical protein